MTRMTLSTSVCSTSCTDARIVCVRSSTTSILIAGDIDFASSGRSAFTRSLVSMMFAPGWRRMMSSTARAPFIHAATRLFSTSSKTSATSREPHRGAILYATTSGFIGRGVEELIVRRDAADCAAPMNEPFGSSTVVLRDRGAHVLEAEADAGDRRGIDLHAHGRLLAAADGHLADAGHLRDLLREHVVRDVEDLRERHGVARQRQDEDRRVGRVDLPVRGSQRQVRRELTSRGGDRRLHVACGCIDVAIEIELQRDGRRAERARRGDFADARDSPESALEWRRDGRRHRLGVRAGERGGDLNRREVDARERRHGEQRVRP